MVNSAGETATVIAMLSEPAKVSWRKARVCHGPRRCAVSNCAVRFARVGRAELTKIVNFDEANAGAALEAGNDRRVVAIGQGRQDGGFTSVGRRQARVLNRPHS